LAIRPDCVIAQKALEKFEQTRNPEFAATMSDDEDEGDEAMDEDLRDDMSRGSGGDWMEREAA
jgi:anaphase-promoting complex subunit 7